MVNMFTLAITLATVNVNVLTLSIGDENIIKYPNNEIGCSKLQLDIEYQCDARL